MKIFKLLYIISSLVFVAKFAEKQTDTFTLWQIASNRPYNPAFATRPLTEKEQIELTHALDQPYTYFGRGGQAYAFFSEDGKYVVKFFKQRLFKRSRLLNSLPLPKILHRYREKRNWKRDDKLARDFGSYKTAFEKLQEETAVIYVHLNQTDHLHHNLQIIDRLGIHHQIPLDTYDFLVQKRAVKTYDKIAEQMARDDLEGAQKTIRAVFSLISSRAQKGYRDRDPNVRTNCGIFDGRAIKIDVGRFVKQDSMKERKEHNAELLQIVTPFREWIAKNYPHLLTPFDEELQEVLF